MHSLTGVINGTELRALRGLRSPEKIQRFLDTEIGYNKELAGPTCYSPRLVLRHGVAHCLEGALLAAVALRLLGFPPLLVDLEAVRDDDHVLAVFRVKSHWGAIAKSNYSGLRFREPVYKTLRELVISYFEHYFNPSKEKTLRRYSRPVNLSHFDRINWMTAERDLWEIPLYLLKIPHRDLLPKGIERRLSLVDDRMFAAGRLGAA